MEKWKKLLAEGLTGFVIEWCQRCKAPSARLIKTFRGGEWIAKPLTTRALAPTGREKFQFPLPLLPLSLALAKTHQNFRAKS